MPLRCTSRGSSTTRAASGSSRMPGDGASTASCRSHWPGWRRWRIAARSGRTANRAMERAWPCRSTGPCWHSWPATAAAARPGIVSLFLPRGRAAERAARALVEATFEAAGLADRRLAVGASSDRCAGGGGRRIATGVRPCDRHAPIAGRGRSPPDLRRRVRTAARRRPAAARDGGPCGWRAARRAVGPVRVGADDRVQGTRQREPAARALPGPAGRLGRRVRRVPPALRHEHAAGLAAGPAVPLDRPQRRDQHGASQPGTGPWTHGGSGRDRDRPRPAGGGPAAGRRRLRLAVARRGARAPDDDRLGSRLGATHDDPRGDGPAPRPAPPRGDPSAADGRVPRAVGRPGRDRVRRWAAGRCAGRPERAAPGGVRRDPRSARRRGVRGGCRAVQRGRDGSARTARAGRAAAGRAGTSGDPRGHRGEGPGPAPAAGPRCAAADVRRPTGRRGGPRHRRRAPHRSSPALPRRARCRARPARHQDDGARRARAAVEHGRRHPDPWSRPPRSAGCRPPAAGVRAGHQPCDRSRAGADRHGPAG